MQSHLTYPRPFVCDEVICEESLCMCYYQIALGGGGLRKQSLFLCVLLSSPGLYNSTVCVSHFLKRINKGRNLLCCVTRVQLGGVGGEITGWYLEFVYLKIGFLKHFVCSVHIWK
jgi:hypothetical protein